MAKSKQRKGHKQKVNARNLKMKSQMNIMQKILNETIKAKMEELKMKGTGNTESESGITENQ